MPPTLSMNTLKTQIATFSVAETVRAGADRAHAHAWTVGPYVRSRLTLDSRTSHPFDGIVHDPERGWVPIVGQFHRHAEARRDLVIVIHGIASCPKEGYVQGIARTLFRDGCDVLRLALRGATGAGTDHYHAGLTADLEAVLADPRLRQYERVSLVGFSLGGQVSVRFAQTTQAERLHKVVAICAPLDMRASQLVLDGWEMTPYRRAILRILKSKYRRLAKNAERMGRSMAADPDAVASVTTFYEWDQTVVCPRFGFESVERYYEQVSSAFALGDLHTPTLLVFADKDPFIPLSAVRPALAQAADAVDVRISQTGGHVGLPKGLDLGFGPQLGLGPQVSHWLRR